MEERAYKFNNYKGDSAVEVITVKESELNVYQKDVLLAELINHYNNVPEEIQSRFLVTLNNAILERQFLEKAKEQSKEETI